MTNERQLYHSYHIENSKHFRSAEQETGTKICMSFKKKIVTPMFPINARFFLMWTIFKVFIGCVTILFLF